MAGVELGEEATGPDVGMDPYNLDPRTGIQVTRPIRSIPTVAQMVYPETTSDILAPVSITAAPQGTQFASLAPEPGKAVNLLPDTPVELMTVKPHAAPVIAQGSVAVPVQERATEFSAQSRHPPVAAPVTLPPAAEVPVVAPGPPQGRSGPVPGHGQGMYGSNLPPAVSADPGANPLLQEQENLAKELQQHKAKADNPLLNFGYRSQADDARKKVLEIQEKMQANDKLIQTQQTNMELAKNYHLFKKMPSTADAAAVVEQAVKEWREQGNYKAYLALQGSGHGGRADIYKTEAMKVLGKDVAIATEQFDKIDKATNENEYRRLREEALKAVKSNPNAQELGLTEDGIPLTKGGYDKRRETIQGVKTSANQMVMDYEHQLRNQGTPKRIADKDHAERILNSTDNKFENGNVIPNTEAVTLPKLGNAAAVKTAVVDLDQYGPGGKHNNWGTKQQEEAAKMVARPEERGAINQHKMATSLRHTLLNDDNYRDAAGITYALDQLTGALRNVAEESRASGTIGFSKMMDEKLGGLERMLAHAMTNYSVYKQWVDGGKKGPEVKPEYRLDQQTITGIKRVANEHYDYTASQIGRLKGVAEYIGQHGGDVKDIGLTEEQQKILEPFVKNSTEKARLDYDKRDAVIIGRNRYMFDEGTVIDPKTPGFIPKGSYAKGKAATERNVEPPPPAVTPPATVAPPPATTAAQVREQLSQPPPPPAATVARPPPPPAATVAPPPAFGAGAAPLPFMPGAPATAVPPAPPPAPGRRSFLETINPISTAQAAEGSPKPAVAANIPSSWGVGVGTGGLPSPVPAVAPAPAAPAAVPPTAARAPAAPTAPAGAAGGGNKVPLTATFKPDTYETGLVAGESNGQNLPPKIPGGASGIHQFLKSTWDQFKPPGAPDEAYKATPAQQKQAFLNFTSKNADALEASGIPINNLTLAMAHQQGAGGATALLKAPDSDKALNHVERKNAAANPRFFWDKDGKPMTVAESKAKFAEFYRTGEGHDVKPRDAKPFPNPQNDKERAENIKAGYHLTDAERAANVTQAKRDVAHMAVPVGTTIGAVGGTVAGGPVGGFAGGVAGGAAGGALENYLLGDPATQNPGGYITSAGLGGVKGGIYSIPGVGPLGIGARTIGGGLVSGAEEYMRSGEIPKTINATAGGMLGGAAGEAVGAVLGKAIGTAYHALPISEQQLVQDAAQIIATQKQGVMDATGKPTINQAYAQAERYLKSRNIDPLAAAHGYNTAVANPTTRGEAFTTRPGEVARMEEGKNLQKVVYKTGSASAASTPTKMQSVMNTMESPENIVRTGPNASKGSVPAIFASEAKEVANQMKAPAKNFGEVMDNFAKARTELLVKQNEARKLEDGTVGKKEAIDAYGKLADHVRTQQEKILDGLLAPKQATAFKDHLNQSSTRYRNAVIAGDKDIVATIAGGGSKGAAAKAAFEAAVKDDVTAKRWMNSLVAAHGKTLKGDMLRVVYTAGGALAAVPMLHPVAGAVLGTISAVQAYRGMEHYLANRAAGRIVTFKEMISKDITPVTDQVRRASGALGTGGGDIAADRMARPVQPAASP